jgi:hypothetical protein
MSIIEKLTEGVINRDLSREADALLNKWEATGLLEGIEGEHNRNSMSCLLENQAKELLREASTMAGGDVEGFAAVAFPIVRRVFGGLVANELVSVQPMSLPSGLIFFLDFTTANTKLGYTECDSIYGGGVVGNEIVNGVNIDGDTEDGETSFYNLNNGYGATTGSATFDHLTVIGERTAAGDWTAFGGRGAAEGDRLIRFDPDVSGSALAVGLLPVASLNDVATGIEFNTQDDVSVCLIDNATGEKMRPDQGSSGLQIRRLTRPDYNDPAGAPAVNLLVVVTGSDANAAGNLITACTDAQFIIRDVFTQGSAVGSIVGAPVWDLEALGLPGDGGGDNCSPGNTGSAIAEIDIKVDSVSITAMTKKLRCKWTPELQQDINAYHNLDAEVELTSILSEAIALEIDQEILEDLIKGATASTFHWSRRPGNFVNRETGAAIAGQFTGTVSEWYETLLETVNDVSAQIHRKTLRGGANFIVTSPEVANLLEFTNGFRASTTADENRGTAGAVKTGTISKKWDVYVDPYFPRNVLLVGRKGSGFLESGYVYAPYVPLQTTPTIFDPENFTPRKGVMTRYGKRMVRPDMYGLVIVEDLLG